MDSLISIITPTYNSEVFIPQTVNSIIKQTYSNWEMLITDDCSTDNTWEILQKLTRQDSRIKIFRLEKNSGPGVARNHSIKMASGRFIAFCDSDDLWKPNKLERQIAFMLQNNYVFSYSDFEIISEGGKLIGCMKVPNQLDYRTMLLNNYIGCLTAIYDSNYFGKVYMPIIKKRQDWGLWLTLLKKTDFAYGMDNELAVYRKREQSVSSSKLRVLKYNWHVYRELEQMSFLESMKYMVLYAFYYLRKKN